MSDTEDTSERAMCDLGREDDVDKFGAMAIVRPVEVARTPLLLTHTLARLERTMHRALKEKGYDPRQHEVEYQLRASVVVPKKRQPGRLP